MAQFIPKMKLRKKFLPILQIFSNYFIAAFGEDYNAWKNIILGSKKGVCVFCFTTQSQLAPSYPEWCL